MATSNNLSLGQVLQRILLGSMWWAILMVIILFVPFLRVWWWLFLPILLSMEAGPLYLWWIQWDYNYANKKWIVLEMIPPKEVLTPLKAMEDVFAVMWGPLYDNPSWREKWCEGPLTDAPGWMSWEIVSIEGNLNFYLRVPAAHKSSLETALYGHYPELEIREVPDYTKNVPQDLPNAEWDTYGEDFVLAKEPGLPIKTYEKFFEPQGEKISAEEKRIDPMSSLLELLSRLGPGEQFWFQFITMPTDDKYNPEFKESSDKLIGKLTKRPVKQHKSFLDQIMEMGFHLVYGPKKEGSGEKATFKWIESAKTEDGEREMVLSPGEREILTEIENKAKKPLFRTVIRGVYVAKRENFNPGNRLIPRVYFGHFNSLVFNFITFSKVTRPKVQYLYRKSRVLKRTRRVFRNYITRFTPLFPDRKRECAVLNTEELATLYHLPLKITGLVAPTMSRVESKKGGPPPNLPVE